MTDRETILDRFGALLATITVANGYKTTVVTVERLIKDWTGVSASQRPWIGYMPRQATYEHNSFNSMHVTLPVMVYAHVSAATVAARDTAVLKLHDDILAAIMSDPTMNQNAIDTTVVLDESDIGDPDTIDMGGVGGTLTLTFNVLYERTTTVQT
jgi:hypothetical protein